MCVTSYNWLFKYYIYANAIKKQCYVIINMQDLVTWYKIQNKKMHLWFVSNKRS